MIISISGYSGSGKDTVGKLAQFLLCKSTGTATLDDVINNYKYQEWWLEEGSGWEIKKWAGKLKLIASLLTGIPVELFEDQDFKKTNMGSEWDTYYFKSPNGEYYHIGTEEDEPIYNKYGCDIQPMTVRDFLQKLGTEGLREGLHKNVWVNALMADYKPPKLSQYNPSKWIITDTRFPNEYKAVKEKDGMLIRVRKPGESPINRHPSETALDSHTFDYEILNDGTIEDLKVKIEDVLRSEKLL